MTAHPYPQKLVTAVANVLWPEMYVSGRAYELADKVLSALWEADQPSTISADEARQLWFKAVDARNGDTESMHELRILLAKHAPDWGDAV